jgi:hypothetical protein
MSIGKHISLEEARKLKKLERFASANKKLLGDTKAFTDLMGRMAKGSPPTKRKPKAA